MSYKLAIASMSLGRAWVHDIHGKFQAAAAAGIPGIEIFFEDLIYLANSYSPSSSTTNNNSTPPTPSPAAQLRAAHEIRRLANTLNLTIIACGPFSNCEGLLSPSAKASKLSELHLWFQICHILQTDIIQIPSTFQSNSPDITGDLDIIVRDLQEISALGAAQNPPFRFAFENLCFGTFVDTWEQAWEIVKRVDRPNFGLCLDTYNIAGREFADPASPTGLASPDAAQRFSESMRRLAREVDGKKVFYLQVVDGERLALPLDEHHPFWVEGQKARMSWSRNARLFVCEEERGGYLPILEVVRAVTEGLGYEGWVSMELFNRSLCMEGEGMPREHAERAVESFKRLERRMGWGREIAARVGGVKGVDLSRVETVEISARL